MSDRFMYASALNRIHTYAKHFGRCCNKSIVGDFGNFSIDTRGIHRKFRAEMIMHSRMLPAVFVAFVNFSKAEAERKFPNRTSERLFFGLISCTRRIAEVTSINRTKPVY